MLPVVVIGADDNVREAFEQWNSGDTDVVLFYDTTEDAVFGLDDRADRASKAAESDPGDPGGYAVEQADDGRWRCSVVYGPLAFGPLATGQRAELLHHGWTVVADSEIRNEQHTPRRVRGQLVEGEHADTMVWHVMAKVAANFVVDVALTAGDTSLAGLERLLRERPTP